MEEVFGYVERLTFQNQETGFTVAQLKTVGSKNVICLVGSLPGIQPGETLRCVGTWLFHPVHGQQFQVVRFQVEAPADLLGIRKYLGSGLVKGIGPKYAGRIVDLFGLNTLDVIEFESEKLLTVPGLGPKRLEKIQSCWSEQKSIRQVMIFLQAQEVTPAFAQKIFRVYGNESIAKIQANPYCLAQDVYGIGFKTADRIAQKMGVGKESAQRIDAGVEFSLSLLSNEGHACYPLALFLEEAEKILEVPIPLIQGRLSYLQQENRIELQEVQNGESKEMRIWSKPLYLTEKGIARELARLQKGQSSLREIQVEKALVWVQQTLNIQLAPKQEEAVAWAITGKVLIITGGPGTGKSTITNAILTIMEKITSRICLAAPTGRAAKRMSEITKRKATTLHALLEFDFKKGGFKKNKENPLLCDLMIIDEASMLDMSLMYSILKALPDTVRLILVGDVNQLPSVGPGSVLKDAILSQCFPVVVLNEIFRQAAGSQIIQNAHRIQQGKMPSVRPDPESDFFFIEDNEPETLLKTLVDLVVERLPKKYGFHPLTDIQLLSPMKRGVIGTENLNRVLQAALNPQEWALTRGAQKYQLKDKVMQIRNNYKKEVFNGDIGYIRAIHPEDQQVVVAFEEREVIYEYYELDELVLAYAISVHKFQGSESPCIVFPVHTTHYMLLNRNLIYTAVTRGRKLVVLAGQKKAVAIAVNRYEDQQRYTHLEPAIRLTSLCF